MLNYPEGTEPVSTPDPGLGDGARLILEVPHWTAVVAVLDNDLSPVSGFSTLEPLPGAVDGAVASAGVPQGAYNIEVRLGGNTQSMWVFAQAGCQTRVPVTTWDRLTVTTSMPLASAIDGVPEGDPMVEAVQKRSLEDAVQSVAQATAAKDARLFLCVRLPKPGTGSQTRWSMDVADSAGTVMTTISNEDSLHEGSFWSQTIDLKAGYYVLRARDLSEDRATSRCQPLYLCANWEHHLFVQCDTAPRLATMSFNMSRLGAGFRADDDSSVAAASVLAALAYDDASSAVLGTWKTDEMLRGEMDNPWLGVLAAYALASSESSVDRLEEVKDYLAGVIGDHPDVRALVEPGSWTAKPEECLPMLRAAYHRIRNHAPAEGPLQSGLRLLCDSAWVAWIEPRDEPGAAAFREGEPPATAERTAEVLSQALPSSAAVYPLGETTGPSASGRQKSFAEEVAIIDAAETVLNAPRGNAPATVTLPAGGSAESLLDVDSETVAEFSAAPRDVVEQGLSRLSGPVEELGLASDSASGRMVQSVLNAIFDAKRSASIVKAAEEVSEEAENRTWWFSTPLEDHIDRLHQEALRLRSIAEDKASVLPSGAIDQCKSVAGRLDGLAEALTQSANLVIIADEDGRLRYGNRLLYDRLKHRQDPGDVLMRLHRGLGSLSKQHAQVSAAELSPTSPEGLRGAMVNVSRTVVHDEQGDALAFIYLLGVADAKTLDAADHERLDTLLPRITLQAATGQHGDGETTEWLRKIESIVGELEQLLPKVG